MALAAAQVTVGVSATQIVAVDTDRSAGQRVVIANSGSETMFVGPSGVTTATGFPISTTTPPFALLLDPGETIFAVSAAGLAVAHVLRSGA